MGETKRERNGSLSKFFADFCRFWSLICKVSGLEPQTPAENRRKPQKIAGSNFDPFLPFSLSHKALPNKSALARDTFEKYRDTPPVSSAMFLQKYAALLAESSTYTANLYHDTAPICIMRCFCGSIRVRGRCNTPKGGFLFAGTCCES